MQLEYIYQIKKKQDKKSQYADDSNFFQKSQESVIKYYNFLKL